MTTTVRLDPSSTATAPAPRGATPAFREWGGHGIAIVSPLCYATTLIGLDQAAGQRAFLHAIGAGHQLVAYDQRGAGATPDDDEQDWAGRAADLWAVADAAGVERAVLLSLIHI